MADQRAAAVRDRVDPAEGVRPVRRLEGALEDLLEHGPDLVEDSGPEVGGVRDAQHPCRVTMFPARRLRGRPSANAPMRTMFLTYLLLIVIGLGYFTIIGLTHH